jgi:hypothetical protein
MTLPTLMLSPGGQFVYHEELGYIEPGEGLGLTVETHSPGQLIRLTSKAWRAYRRRSPAWVVHSLRDSSVHEAGHAIVGTTLGRRVQEVSVFPMSDQGGLSLGRIIFEGQRPSEDLVLEATKLATTNLAGGAADRRGGRGDLPGGERDRRELAENLRLLFPRQTRLRREVMESAELLAEQLVDTAWPSIKQLSRVLLERLEATQSETEASMERLSRRRRRRIERLIATTIPK